MKTKTQTQNTNTNINTNSLWQTQTLKNTHAKTITKANVNARKKNEIWKCEINH